MSQSKADYINVIGAGLAGSEAAYQIAKRGIPVSYTHLTLPTNSLV